MSNNLDTLARSHSHIHTSTPNYIFFVELFLVCETVTPITMAMMAAKAIRTIVIIFHLQNDGLGFSGGSPAYGKLKRRS